MAGGQSSECTMGVDNQRRIINLEQNRTADRSENESDHREMWEAINRIKDRPPVWATVVISVLTCLLGILGTVAVLSGKLATIG